jgi:hypothetical protein
MIIVAIVVLIIGGSIGYFAAPKQTETEIVTETVEVAPLDGKNVQIGYLTGTTGLEAAQPWYDEIDKDMNSYAEQLGYDVTFEYMIDSHENQAAIHLEKV